MEGEKPSKASGEALGMRVRSRFCHSGLWKEKLALGRCLPVQMVGWGLLGIELPGTAALGVHGLQFCSHEQLTFHTGALCFSL